MKIHKLMKEPFIKVKNRQRGTGRRRIAGAFIAGMVIAAAPVQILVNADMFNQREIRENIVPPQSNPSFPGLDVPSHFPPVFPGERHLNGLVYALV